MVALKKGGGLTSFGRWNELLNGGITISIPTRDQLTAGLLGKSNPINTIH